jgi:AcrR family transcriptional regulator
VGTTTEGSGRRRTRTPSADIEAALLDAAERQLDREGPTGLSVRKIAAAAGVAPMGVYNHFEGKNGVVDALCRRGFAALGEALAPMALEEDPCTALRVGGRAYRAVALAHPTTYAVMFLSAVPGYEPSEETHESALAAFGVLADTVARGIRAGTFRAADPTETAQVVWGAIHGAVALELADIGFVDDRTNAYEMLLDTIAAGLGC